MSRLSYICFCKAAAFASVLVFGYKLVDYAVLQYLTTYFTDSSNYNLEKAATFVNSREVLSASFAFIYIRYAFRSPLTVIICSAAFCICGLVALFLTTLALFREKTDIFNIIGVVHLAAGEAGLKTFLKAFLGDQLRAHEPNHNENQVKARRRMWWVVAWICSVLAAYYVNDTLWLKTLIISASIMGVTLILFLLGICFYHSKESADRGRRLAIFPVLWASILNRNLDYPTSPRQFYRNNGNQLCLSPPIKILRRLDKSAISDPSYRSADDQRKAGRLCTVKEVEEIKCVFRMVPLWVNFVVLGLLVSTANTFFPEQGYNMNNSKFYIFVLIIPSVLGKIKGFLSILFVPNWDEKTKNQVNKWKIWAGMVLSIFCCAVAWRVEVHRLNIVNKEGGNSDENTPMSVFWLAPQFFLLGLMLVLATDGLDEIAIEQFEELPKEYVTTINEFVIAIGSFLNIVYVHANGSRFSKSLNEIHLDKHYHTLTVVSFINFCIYLFISPIYTAMRRR
ncbi:protein NRT1/ PTR FAMILY 5.6-like [Mangifera indica]|uniref:protein NRT1/ PTR FAMILY 5.6-like n=1 Tax=Mangifera indica TaxID=29780 RepID=UPI001CFB5988|nr:protein NRT1/ PTR FAMILY 5.6-like [Mangifera indica]